MPGWKPATDACGQGHRFSHRGLRPQLDGLSLEEKRKLAAYVRHSLRVDSEENRQELARRNREMAAGKVYDLAEVKATLAKLHGAPNAGWRSAGD